MNSVNWECEGAALQFFSDTSHLERNKNEYDLIQRIVQHLQL